MKAIIITLVVVFILYKISDTSEQAKYDRYMEDVPEGDKEYHQRRK